uniref:Uncharacterized protein n=1 Tax=viral metagenome TaxID=1070528 RepID=A0A6C0KE35_9ZZZZ
MADEDYEDDCIASVFGDDDDCRCIKCQSRYRRPGQEYYRVLPGSMNEDEILTQLIRSDNIPAFVSHFKKIKCIYFRLTKRNSNPETHLLIGDYPTDLMFYALRKNRPGIIKFLVQKGADTVNSYSFWGRDRPAFYAALTPELNLLENAIALVETADLTWTDHYHHHEWSVWWMVIDRPSYLKGFVVNEDLIIELLRLILEKKDTGTPCPDIDHSALELAVSNHLVDTTAYLLRLGANAYDLNQLGKCLTSDYDLQCLCQKYPSMRRIYKCGSQSIKECRLKPLTLVSQLRISRKHTHLKKIGKYTWKHILQFAFDSHAEILEFPKTDLEYTAASEAIWDLVKPRPPLPRMNNFYTVNPLCPDSGL